MSSRFDPYHRWLGVAPEDQPADYYQLMGTRRFESDLDVIESAADRQMAHVRTFSSGQHAALSQKLLNELSQARTVLLNPEKKSRYDQQLRNHYGPAEPSPTAPASAAEPAASRPMIEVQKSAPGPSRAKKRKQGSGKLLAIGLAVVALVAVSAAVVAVLQSNNGDPNEVAGAGADEDPPNVDLENVDLGQANPAKGNGSAADAPNENAAERATSEASSEFETPPTENDAAPDDQTSASDDERPTSEKPDAEGTARAISDTGQTPTVETNDAPPEAPDAQPGVPTTTTPAATPVARQPLPDSVAQNSAMQELQSAVDLNPKSEEESRELVAQLLSLAGESEGATRYVILNTARKLSAESGRLSEAMATIDRLSKEYDVEESSLRMATLQEAIRTTPQRSNPEVVLLGLPFIRQLVDDERFDEAASLANQLLGIARRAKNPALLEMATTARRESDKLAKSYKRARAALAKLEVDENDQAANDAVAQFYLRSKPDWSRALPYLARSGGEAAAAAKQEIDARGAPSKALAEAWWEASKTQRSNKELADVFLGRAITYYVQLESASTGLEKLAATKRIAEGLSKPLPVSARHHFVAPANLVELIEPADIVSESKLRFTGYEVHVEGSAQFNFPVQMTSNNYEVNLALSRESGQWGVHMLLPVGDNYVNAIFASKKTAASAPHASIEIINGKNHWHNRSRRPHPTLSDGKAHLCTVRVQSANGNAKVDLFFDRKRVTGWEGPAVQLGASKPPSEPGRIQLGLSEGTTTVHQFSINVADGRLLPSRIETRAPSQDSTPISPAEE